MFELVVLALISQQPLMPAVEGTASYYTVAETSSITASGERFRNEAYTCAMKQGEFGKYYLVVADNGNSVVCRLNDRGPFVKGRVIDLSRAAMRKLHPTAGTIRVKVYPLGDRVPDHPVAFH
jgi:rare lipoprotein A